MSDSLSSKQQRAIVALMQCRTLSEAARQAKISERQIHRWMQESAFKMALRQAESAMIDEAARRVLALQGKAISILESILNDESPLAKREQRHVAQMLLEHPLKLRSRNLQDQLDAIQAQLNELRRSQQTN